MTDPKAFREFIAIPVWAKHYGRLTDGLTDEELQGIIDGAKKWIAGRRSSWKIVTANSLRDGYYHG